MLDFDFGGRQKDAMESTPPPVPSAPLRSQPPSKNWWSRNWKWFVPTGCLTLIGMGAAFFVCIFLLVFSVLKSSDAYKTALSRAKNDQRVIAALGTPIHDGFVPSGKTNVNGASGEADLAIPISGPKGKATIYAVGTKSTGNWEFSKLAVQIDGGEMIDLNEKDAIQSTVTIMLKLPLRNAFIAAVGLVGMTFSGRASNPNELQLLAKKASNDRSSKEGYDYETKFFDAIDPVLIC